MHFRLKTMVLCRFSGGATMVLRRLRFSNGRQKWDPIAPTSISKVVRTRTWARFESTSAGRIPPPAWPRSGSDPEPPQVQRMTLGVNVVSATCTGAGVRQRLGRIGNRCHRTKALTSFPSKHEGFMPLEFPPPPPPPLRPHGSESAPLMQQTLSVVQLVGLGSTPPIQRVSEYETRPCRFGCRRRHGSLSHGT